MEKITGVGGVRAVLMLAAVFAFTLFMGMPSASAAPIDFYWSAIPSEREDNKPLPIEEVIRLEVWCDGGIVGSAAPSATSATFELPSGEYECVGVVIATASDEGGELSALPSGSVEIVVFAVEYARPKPLEGFGSSSAR